MSAFWWGFRMGAMSALRTFWPGAALAVVVIVIHGVTS